ncbi:MAG: glycosyltransferase [Isosphaeraceae bacterium]
MSMPVTLRSIRFPRADRLREGTGARPLVVHVIDELKVGGAQTHLATMLVESLRAFPDVRHRVVSLFGDGPIGRRIRELGVDVDVLDMRPHFARGRFGPAAGELRARFRRLRPDVVEAHLTWSRLLGLYAAWRAGVRVRIGFEQGDIYLRSWKFRAANFVGQVFARRIIACSQALADWDRRTYGFSSRRLVVMANCVEPTRFGPGIEAVSRETLGLPKGTMAFVAVGTLGRGVDKRTDVLVRAIAAARGRGAAVGLIVCGDGERRGGLEGLADSLGVGAFVRFLGTRDDVPRVIAGCDAFCHAAPFEPFGIACIEAMASGLPVVVPDAGGIREAVEPGVTGLVYPPLDVARLADAIQTLHDNPSLRGTMGQAARHTVVSQFSVEGYVRRLHDLYGLGETRSEEALR